MLKTSSLRMTPVEWILLFILGGFWGCTFFFNEIAILELPPLSIILFRVGLASIILWIVVFASGITILQVAANPLAAALGRARQGRPRPW